MGCGGADYSTRKGRSTLAQEMRAGFQYMNEPFSEEDVIGWSGMAKMIWALLRIEFEFLRVADKGTHMEGSTLGLPSFKFPHHIYAGEPNPC